MKPWTLWIAAVLLTIPLAGQTDQGQKNAASSYHHHCAKCHGGDGKGHSFVGKMVHPPDLTSQSVQEQSDATLADTIRNGKGKMPAFPKLSDDEIQRLVAYVRHFAGR